MQEVLLTPSRKRHHITGPITRKLDNYSKPPTRLLKRTMDVSFTFYEGGLTERNRRTFVCKGKF